MGPYESQKTQEYTDASLQRYVQEALKQSGINVSRARMRTVDHHNQFIQNIDALDKTCLSILMSKSSQRLTIPVRKILRATHCYTAHRKEIDTKAACVYTEEEEGKPELYVVSARV